MGIKDVWGGYREHHHPRAMMFVPLKGMSASDEYRDRLDQLDLTSVFMASYVKHRVVCLFEKINLYTGWLRYGTCKVRYIPERVLRQFGYTRTILRSPHDSVPVQMTLGEISYCYAHHLDHALRALELGQPTIQGVEAESG